jgi:hypothetical protein
VELKEQTIAIIDHHEPEPLAQDAQTEIDYILRQECGDEDVW